MWRNFATLAKNFVLRQFCVWLYKYSANICTIFGNFYATGQFFIVVIGQRLKNNLAIWSHWVASIAVTFDCHTVGSDGKLIYDLFSSVSKHRFCKIFCQLLVQVSGLIVFPVWPEWRNVAIFGKILPFCTFKIFGISYL